VPDEILNHDIENSIINGTWYNIMTPKMVGKGTTKFFVSKENSLFCFALIGENLDEQTQEILINSAMSVNFQEE
jgi:hypothetical protein